VPVGNLRHRTVLQSANESVTIGMRVPSDPVSSLASMSPPSHLWPVLNHLPWLFSSLYIVPLGSPFYSKVSTTADSQISKEHSFAEISISC
jgi:hypothetical protein